MSKKPTYTQTFKYLTSKLFSFITEKYSHFIAILVFHNILIKIYHGLRMSLFHLQYNNNEFFKNSLIFKFRSTHKKFENRPLKNGKYIMNLVTFQFTDEEKVIYKGLKLRCFLYTAFSFFINFFVVWSPFESDLVSLSSLVNIRGYSSSTSCD